MSRAPRWRITLDELCRACGVVPHVLDRWAALGALGPRWTEPRSRGRWQHMTREGAQRAVVCARLVQAGVTERTAVKLAALHEVGDDTPLRIEISDSVTVVVDRTDLP